MSEVLKSIFCKRVNDRIGSTSSPSFVMSCRAACVGVVQLLCVVQLVPLCNFNKGTVSALVFVFWTLSQIWDNILYVQKVKPEMLFSILVKPYFYKTMILCFFLWRDKTECCQMNWAQLVLQGLHNMSHSLRHFQGWNSLQVSSYLGKLPFWRCFECQWMDCISRTNTS